MAAPPLPERQDERDDTVFWRLAALLTVGMLVLALGTVGLVGWRAQEHFERLVRNSLLLRFDSVAEEVEARAAFSADGALHFADALRTDLRARLPDPALLLGPSGAVVDTLSGERVSVPPGLLDTARAALDEGTLAVDLAATPAWAAIPLYDPEGVPAGGLVVVGLDRAAAREEGGVREAYVRTLALVSVLAVLLAAALAATLTWALVRPLRRIGRRVEAIGAGDFAARLPEHRRDEFGRLGAAVNAMAERVERSIEALRAADANRQRLVQNVGHDLRTPLAALAGYLEEVDRLAAAGRPEAAAALAVARRQAAAVEAVVADLFELSLFEGADAAAPLRLGPVPLGELLADAAAGHARACEAAGVGLVRAWPAGLPVLEADGGRLLRVLSNLLANALRFTPPGGAVRLSADVEGGQVRVRVSDSGPGIPEAERERVFERYYSGTGARTRGEEGTGLGLAIARAIARAHGGDLTVGDGPEGGAAFTLALPLGRP